MGEEPQVIIVINTEQEMTAIHPRRGRHRTSRSLYCIFFLPTFGAFVVLFMLILALFAPENIECRLNVPQTIRKWGYPVETHSVTTDDGYIIDLHRIPHGRNQAHRNTSCRPVILLQHGLEMDSSNWVDNQPDQAAAFVFADAGFDVFLGNVRGNRYGRKHRHLDPATDKQFWKFSWSDMADRDLPAMINRALKESGAETLHYVGHSQGSLIMFARLSEDHEMNSKIASFHALAPAVFVNHIKGLFGRFSWAIPLLQWWNAHPALGELVPVAFFKLASSSVCAHTFSFGICSSILFNIAGPQSRFYNETRTPVYFSHFLSGTSSRNVVHWTQMVFGSATKKFDFNDKRKNMAAYNSPSPPSYDFSRVSVPLHLYWGNNDWLVSDEDVERELMPVLNGTNIRSRKKLNEYNHFDFVWGTTAAHDVYHPIIDSVRDVEAEKAHSSCMISRFPASFSPI